MRNCKLFYQVGCFIQLSETGVLSVSLKMGKIEYPAFIKFSVKEGLTPNEIHSKFIKVYGNSSPSFSAIKKWAAELRETEVTVQRLFSMFKFANFYQYTQLPCVTPELATCFRDSSCLNHLSVTFDNKVEDVIKLRIEEAASGQGTCL